MQWISHTNWAMIDHAPLIERCIEQPPHTVMDSSSVQWSVSLKCFQVPNFNIKIIPALKRMLFVANSVCYSETTCLWTNQRRKQKSYSPDTRKQLKKDVFSPDAITSINKGWRVGDVADRLERPYALFSCDQLKERVWNLPFAKKDRFETMQ